MGCGWVDAGSLTCSTRPFQLTLLAPTQHLCHEPPFGGVGLPSQVLPWSSYSFCRPVIILSVLPCGCWG